MKWAPLLAAVTVAQPLAAQDAVVVLGTAESAYEQIITLKAEFRQTIINPMLGGPEESQGVLYLSPPDRFSMRFSDPKGDRIVADGTWLWLFTPSTVPDQVIRQTIPTSGTATPNLFAQFAHRPLERYDASYVGPDTVAGLQVDRVRLIPRVQGVPFRQAVISVSRGDGLLRKVALVEESGQRRTFVFDSVDINIPIPAAELVFRPPQGTRIVTPD
jgi:outer membrane lipoprotein carrier protein